MLRLLVLLYLFITTTTYSTDFYVDPSLGDDHANGLAAKPDAPNAPVKTIVRGLKLAQAGDTVHLAPAVYRESAVFNNRAGEEGAE
jgi:hypothetical protein